MIGSTAVVFNAPAVRFFVAEALLWVDSTTRVLSPTAAATVLVLGFGTTAAAAAALDDFCFELPVLPVLPWVFPFLDLMFLSTTESTRGVLCPFPRAVVVAAAAAFRYASFFTTGKTVRPLLVVAWPKNGCLIESSANTTCYNDMNIISNC